MRNALKSIHHGLVVSCQAYGDEPMHETRIMTAVAKAAAQGGAVGIRAQGLHDVASIHREVPLPLIGLVKVGTSGVFITPTVADCRAVAEAGAEIVAFDGTRRERPDGRGLADCVRTIHEAGAIALADCGCVEDAVVSIEAGADCVSTTLAGYSGARPRTEGPDLELLADLVALGRVPVIAEGRIHTPEQARRAAELGAHTVVVGTAITHPTTITRWFAAEVEGASGRQAGGPTGLMERRE